MKMFGRKTHILKSGGTVLSLKYSLVTVSASQNLTLKDKTQINYILRLHSLQSSV